jgi:hypothetical protein
VFDVGDILILSFAIRSYRIFPHHCRHILVGRGALLPSTNPTAISSAAWYLVGPPILHRFQASYQTIRGTLDLKFGVRVWEL